MSPVLLILLVPVVLQEPARPARPAPVEVVRLEPWQERARLEKLPVAAARELTAAQADGRARAAFAALDAKEQKEVLDWFENECSKLGTFQVGLVRWVLDQQTERLDGFPPVEPLTWFDPVKHAERQPIPRVPLDPAAPEVQAVRHKILGAHNARRADSGWVYDYARKALLRQPHEAAAQRRFENALCGLPLHWDFAEAWAEMKLDDGSQQKVAQAFAHAYTDRTGGVYAGVTLYDAHASRTDLEMPDVDTLGIMHELLDDWTTYKSVVSERQHAPLFAKINELFTPYHRHRALRTNVARAFVCGSTELRDRYQHNLENFHWLWESASSDPGALAPKLPQPAQWAEFLDGTFRHLNETPQDAVRAFTRKKTLDADALRVRDTLFWVLDQYGAFARIEAPPTFR